jgi:hypothetical protein
MTGFTLTRGQLYDLVWSEPMRNLAKQIGISDTAIAKHCRRADIPMPGVGYWNKLQAGQKVAQEDLPEEDLGSVRRIEMATGTLPPALLARIKGEPGSLSDEEGNIEELAERFRKRLGKVKAPRNLVPLHPAIGTLLKKDEKIRQEIAASTLSFHWREPRFDAPAERRRLRLLNGIFLAVTKTGGSAWAQGDYAREIGVSIGGRGIMFELDYAGRAARYGERPSPPKEGVKAKLRLSLGTHHEPSAPATAWEDKDYLPLEDQLTEIVVGLAVESENLQRRWLAQQAEWRREEKERQEKEERDAREAEARRERERLAAIEKAKLETLLREADGWHKANQVRAYVAAARRAPRGGDPSFEAWAAWALQEADRLDPLVSGLAAEAPVQPGSTPAG